MSSRQTRQIDRVLSVFEVAFQHGTQSWKAKCPAHPDHDASLHISVGHTGKIVMHCYGGCKTQDVLKAVGLTFKDLSADDVIEGTPALPTHVPAFSVARLTHRHAVYSELLRGLSLSHEHRRELESRGFTNQDITAREYRTFDWWAVQQKISADQWKLDLNGVPGFRDIGSRFEAANISGLVIPVRSLTGSIQALQVRSSTARSKYRWFSWSGQTTAVPHTPLGVSLEYPTKEVRLTEGPLKADAATILDKDIFTVAVPGVSNWRSSLALLKMLRLLAGVERVRLAFDMDWKDNSAVYSQLDAARRGLELDGFQVIREEWENGTGIDDYLLWRQQHGGEQRSDAGVSSLPA